MSHSSLEFGPFSFSALLCSPCSYISPGKFYTMNSAGPSISPMRVCVCVCIPSDTRLGQLLCCRVLLLSLLAISSGEFSISKGLPFSQSRVTQSNLFYTLCERLTKPTISERSGVVCAAIYARAIRD